MEDEGGKILADPTQIHQILMNLATNAAHAMQQDGGELTITLTRERVVPPTISSSLPDVSPGTYLQLSVTDTGHGMDGATVEKVFDPFFSTKTRSEGTGLGLSVVHGIVKAHDGRIQVESRPGQGTAFTLLFPCIEEKRSVSRDHSPKTLPSGAERILFVDDDETIVRLAG